MSTQIILCQALTKRRERRTVAYKDYIFGEIQKES